MNKKTKILIGVGVAVVAIIVIAIAAGGGGARQEGYDDGYAAVMKDFANQREVARVVADVIRDHEAGRTIGKHTPRDDDPKYVAGYKAGMRAAAKELDSR